MLSRCYFRVIPIFLALVLFLRTPHLSFAQPPKDMAAEVLFNSACKAFNDQNYPFATAKFSEFIQKYGNHPQVNAARYGLALCYLDGSERNFEKAIDPLNALAGNAMIVEQPRALYYLGIAKRGLGMADVTLATSKQGAESQQIMQRANGRFTEALQHFVAAEKAFRSRISAAASKTPAASDLDWLARSLTEKAEMEIRTGRYKEARETAEMLMKDPQLNKNRFARLGLYYHGFASFLLHDYLVAGRSLNQLQPFTDPHSGLHACYLMGRIYQITEEPDKALVMYNKVLLDYAQQKKDAMESLKRPDLLKNNPAEFQRLQKLVQGPVPEALIGSTFFSACLAYEAARYGEALGKLQSFLKEYARSPLVPEAVMRIGFCQVQLKQYQEALNTLNPLLNNNPRLADQVRLWIGKAQVGLALAVDPANTAARENGLKTAIASLRSAADSAAQLANNDPDARIRRSEIMLELADTLQLARQPRDAVGIYEQLLNEKMLPQRVEEIWQRMITALHLASDFGRVDQLCQQYQKDFPRGSLLADAQLQKRIRCL